MALFLEHIPGLGKAVILVTFMYFCCFSVVNSVQNDSGLTQTFLEATESVSLKQLLSDFPANSSLNASCLDSADNYRNLKSCLKTQCVSAGDVAALYHLSAETPLDRDELSRVAPAVVYSLRQSESCVSDANTHSKQHKRPSSAAVWGYSFLFVTLINLCSLTGILVLPCMKKAFYKTLLMFMVALAVGTLLASGVLVLIPEAFELVGGEDDEGSTDYVWKATAIMGGVYLFFITERVMRMINQWRENTKEKKHFDEVCTRESITSSFTRKTPTNASLKLKDPTTVPVSSSSGPCSCIEEEDENSVDKSPMPSAKSSVAEKGEHHEEDPVNCDSNGALVKKYQNPAKEKDSPRRRLRRGGPHHAHHHQNSVAPVAYMIIFGDGLHNFIDGLSIGAAFTDNILVGISVSVAVMCEELPHELGDFAILLNAGMRLRKALAYNFLSSLMCYLGLIIGILLGENTSAHTWIFGLAGGMFLYISLADMMPEMNSAAESEDGLRFGTKKTFLLQNVGLLVGYSLILLIALYGGEINFE